jgi:serine/threonine protein kinase
MTNIFTTLSRTNHDPININKLDIYRIGGECKYEVFRSNKLGSGRYSNVYLGRCLNRDKILQIGRSDGIVAIKKINMFGVSFDTHKMLLNEIAIMKKIIQYEHPNIIMCYDVIEDIDTTYIVMEYCGDGHLGNILIKPMKLVNIKYYFRQLLSALYFLHSYDILHRDVKPTNILLTNDKKNLKICDFGFAKITTKMQRVSTICGSPLYMAPEILNHKKYDSACDIWALGMILFEMMYGYHPCGNCKDIDELTDYISKKKIKFPPVGEINNTLDNECIELLTRMLEIDDTKRITLAELFIHPWFIDNSKQNAANLNDQTNTHIEEFKYIDTKSTSSQNETLYDFLSLKNDFDDLYCFSDDLIKIATDSSRSSVCMFELDDV